MKNLAISLLLVISTAACHISRPANGQKVGPYAHFGTLADALRTFGSVKVIGLGADPKIVVNRNDQNSQPLYILDDVRMGYSYHLVNNRIQMPHVRSIRVLNNLHELNRYGVEGKNGVILISTQVKNLEKTSEARMGNIITNP